MIFVKLKYETCLCRIRSLEGLLPGAAAFHQLGDLSAGTESNTD